MDFQKFIAFFIMQERTKAMYRINEKECDPQLPCIDLNELSSYLVIPSKFLVPQQQLKIYPSRRRAEIYYSIDRLYLDHIQTQYKSPIEELEFFGIKHPSGRIETLTIRRTKFDEDKLHVFVKRHARKEITIKKVPGGTDEEKNVKTRLNSRAIQQRLTFGDLCGRNPTSAARIY